MVCGLGVGVGVGRLDEIQPHQRTDREPFSVPLPRIVFRRLGSHQAKKRFDEEKKKHFKVTSTYDAKKTNTTHIIGGCYMLAGICTALWELHGFLNPKPSHQPINHVNLNTTIILFCMSGFCFFLNKARSTRFMDKVYQQTFVQCDFLAATCTQTLL